MRPPALQSNPDMPLFDSHCHLDDDAFRKDVPAVLNRAQTAGVDTLLTVGVDVTTSRMAVAIAESHDSVFASVGIHPHDAAQGSEAAIRELTRLAESPRARAWGEIGLDFYRMRSPQELQEKWLIRQLEASHALDLPVIFHERDSGGRFTEILRDRFSPGRSGVVHCFSGNRSELTAYLDLGLCIGVTGIVTMVQRGAPLRELLPAVPLERLLIETDSPYLVPAPERRRTRRNEPAFVRSVLLKLADTLGIDPTRLARITHENACRLFRIAPPEVGKAPLSA